MKKVLPLVLLISTFLAACGPKAEPTLSPINVQETANALAFTMIAMTQTAQPTATPVPPTATATVPPPATPTTFQLPTFPVATATFPASGDPCNAPLPAEPAGKMTTLRIVNEYKAPANFSIYLYKTPFGECGYRGYTIGKNSSIVITFPQGCYSFYAWINDPKKPTTAEGGGPGACTNNDDKWTIYIRDENIILKPP